jgi:hypothetical protein
LSLHAFALATGVSILAGAARAHTVEKKSLDRDGAKRVIAAALNEAQRRHTTGVVAVVES